MDKFDSATMIFFSITDAFTSFGITILFYQIGKNEYSKSRNSKETNRERSKIPSQQEEAWQQRLGHKNFKDSEVDEGGDLSKLCQDEIGLIPSYTEGGYGQLYTNPQETKILSDKGTYIQSENSKQPSIFQNYLSEVEEEEK